MLPGDELQVFRNSDLTIDTLPYVQSLNVPIFPPHCVEQIKSPSSQ